MDIIAAHQQGLIEKLSEEAAALAGRPNDFGQRAVVLTIFTTIRAGSTIGLWPRPGAISSLPRGWPGCSAGLGGGDGWRRGANGRGWRLKP